MENLRGRTLLAILGVVIALVWVAPNIFGQKSFLPKQVLNYGLDIQGGLHLVMGVDVAGVVSESVVRLAPVIKTELSKEGVSVTDVKSTKAAEGEMEIQFTGGGEARVKAKKFVEDRYGTMLQVMTDNESSMTVRYYDAYMLDYRKRVIDQAIETIRNRIDEFGVAEPSISAQGGDRILVQLPGMADAERAKQLINTTAKLDFMMVADEQGDLTKLIADAEKEGKYVLAGVKGVEGATELKYSDYVQRLNNDLKAKIPAGTMVLFQKNDDVATMDLGRFPFLLKTDTGLGGESLDEAFVSFNEYQNPEVSLRFNPLGAGKFKTITGANVGKRLAVVLDKVVKTAPVLQTQINDGRAVITLGGSRNAEKAMEEAKMIATALRAGALPASLEQLEERRIGPSLGSDSIERAKKAALIGSLLIILFMFFRYKAMGLITNLSLGVNILSVFALLTSLGATLTLPGIAGIALTVGFAVDANVLINERIREELAKGTSFKLALKEGYHRAMSAILDANITTAATAVVLLYFGTGPVRGFAVTLLVGIVTTLFANVFVSKVLVDWIVHKFGVKQLSV